MIHQLKNDGVSVSEISRRLKIDRKTVRRYVQQGLEPPAYGPRKPRGSCLDQYKDYLQARVGLQPGLSATRLLRDIKAMGFQGSYTTLTTFLRSIRPCDNHEYEVRYETPAGFQAQADFAHFAVRFTNEPEVELVVWLFSMALAKHYGFVPKACKAYRAKTKGKVERPFRYIRQDFFLDGTFQNIEDLNAQFDRWLAEIAHTREHGTTRRIVQEHFQEERASLQPLPAGIFDDVLSSERRVTRDGMVSVDGNLYSVPNGLQLSSVQVERTATALRLKHEEQLLAVHPLLIGRGQRQVLEGHRARVKPHNITTLADLIAALTKAERENNHRLRYINRAALLIIDEVGYLPNDKNGANLFFQLVNARYEKGATIFTSNRGFKEWGEIFGDNVIAAALLDRLLHRATVLEIAGNSYRLREYADLVPETLKRGGVTEETAKRKPGRPRKIPLPDSAQP